MYKYLLVIWLMAGCSLAAMAQSPDTTSKHIKNKDTLISTKQDTDVVRSYLHPNTPKKKKDKVYHPDTLHNPHTAVMRSLFIPGWGQAYNHRWWKVPIVYGTLGLIGWAYVFNANYYREFLALTEYRYHGIEPKVGDKYYNEYQAYKAANVPDQSIYDAKDGYRRNRDLSILGFVAFWGINCVDAYIDAKFIHSYAVDSNLALKVAPSMITQPLYAQSAVGSFIPAIKITFTL
jgi:hypothetical protein